MELASEQKRISLTNVVPALHAWLAQQPDQSFGIFHSIIVERHHEQSYAVMVLQQAKVHQDKDTIALAEILVTLSSMQRRKLSAIWHLYDPTSKAIPPSQPTRRSTDNRLD